MLTPFKLHEPNITLLLLNCQDVRLEIASFPRFVSLRLLNMFDHGPLRYRTLLPTKSHWRRGDVNP